MKIGNDLALEAVGFLVGQAAADDAFGDFRPGPDRLYKVTAPARISFNREGKDEMTKASIDLQDLRRRLYVKAKAETSWRFCK